MRNYLGVMTALGLTAAAHTSALAGCNTQVGQTVVPELPYFIYEGLARINSEKDEFETSAAFNKRKADAEAAFARRDYISTVAPWTGSMQYDADLQKLKVSQYAWMLTSTGFRTIFVEGNKYGVPAVGFDTVTHGLGLEEIFVLGGSYIGTNVYGARTTVSSSNNKIYSVFDRVAKSGEETWQLDYGPSGKPTLEDYDPGGVYIDATPERAKALKETIQFAVEFTPKRPYTSEGADRISPTLQTPVSATSNVHTIFADIRCVLILDEERTVLRVVDVNYE